MTLTHFPKGDFWNFTWIFFPKMTLTHFPVFGFFFQNTRIGVNTQNTLKVLILKRYFYPGSLFLSNKTYKYYILFPDLHVCLVSSEKTEIETNETIQNKRYERV